MTTALSTGPTTCPPGSCPIRAAGSNLTCPCVGHPRYGVLMARDPETWGPLIVETARSRAGERPAPRPRISTSPASDSNRPHGLDPVGNPVVLSLYKTLTTGQNVIGLGVNASHTTLSLRSMGSPADALGIASAAEIHALLKVRPSVRLVVIEAPWLPTFDLESLGREFPAVRFLMRVHSQIAFLQVDPRGVTLCRDAAQSPLENVGLAANSPRFSRWFSESYQAPCALLPNLYHANEPAPRPQGNPAGPIRLGSFGSLRLQKHHATSAAAAMLVARRLGRPLEFLVNSKRDEHTGILSMLREMFAGLDWAKLVEVPWEAAPDFRQTIASLDLHFQLSATETFNITVADAIAAGVPSVVGEAIDWCPADWRAPIDDPGKAAEVAIRLLADPTAPARGHEALEAHQVEARAAWRDLIGSLSGPRSIAPVAPYTDLRPLVWACDYRGEVLDVLTG